MIMNSNTRWGSVDSPTGDRDAQTLLKMLSVSIFAHVPDASYVFHLCLYVFAH